MVAQREVWIQVCGGLLVCLAMAFAGCSQAPPEGLGDLEKKAEIDEMYAGYREDFEGILEMSPEELAGKMGSESLVILDVREPEERAVSVLKGSISVEEYERDKAKYEGHTVVAHCTIGYRSGVYVKELQAEGIEAYNLPGSILAWVHAGQPVVDSEGAETKSVHVYGAKWDLLPEGYEGVW